MSGNLRVFVYGTLRKGFEGHSLLSASRFRGRAKTKEKYALYMGEFPSVFKQEKISLIFGEVYEINKKTLKLLDDFEGHPDYYTRELIDVILEDGSSLQAWIYFHPNPEGTMIDSGDFLSYIFEGSGSFFY